MQLFVSSGDLIADRRFEFAKDLEKRGDLAAAADLYAQAVEVAPGFASAWFALGEVKARLGDNAAAIYNHLHVSDVLEFLAREGERSADLVIAANSLPYCSDLAPLVRAAARVLDAGGLFAFTVETHDGPGVLLRETMRYAHGEDHVRAALTAAGLAVVSLAAASSRREKSIPVPGLVVVAAKPASTVPPSGISSTQ